MNFFSSVEEMADCFRMYREKNEANELSLVAMSIGPDDSGRESSEFTLALVCLDTFTKREGAEAFAVGTMISDSGDAPKAYEKDGVEVIHRSICQLLDVKLGLEYDV